MTAHIITVRVLVDMPEHGDIYRSLNALFESKKADEVGVIDHGYLHEHGDAPAHELIQRLITSGVYCAGDMFTLEKAV